MSDLLTWARIGKISREIIEQDIFGKQIELGNDICDRCGKETEKIYQLDEIKKQIKKKTQIHEVIAKRIHLCEKCYQKIDKE